MLELSERFSSEILKIVSLEISVIQLTQSTWLFIRGPAKREVFTPFLSLNLECQFPIVWNFTSIRGCCKVTIWMQWQIADVCQAPASFCHLKLFSPVVTLSHPNHRSAFYANERFTGTEIVDTLWQEYWWFILDERLLRMWGTG